MSQVDIQTLCVGPLGVNCYIVSRKTTNRALVIDPGDDAEDVVAALRDAELTLEAVLLTHGHFDHIHGVPGVVAAFGIPVYLHEADHALYHSPRNAMPPLVPPTPNLPKPQPVLPPTPGFDVQVLHTPGHTPGGVSFLLSDDNVLFSGDTLFAGSVGRSDFPGGSAADLMDSITNTLFALPGNTRVYPGHYGPTTIAQERDHNPFVR
jgi:glyoxylase-like metal-dependent hydrolase (beta-lactamase superfamily II)